MTVAYTACIIPVVYMYSCVLKLCKLFNSQYVISFSLENVHGKVWLKNKQCSYSKYATVCLFGLIDIIRQIVLRKNKLNPKISMDDIMLYNHNVVFRTKAHLPRIVIIID